MVFTLGQRALVRPWLWLSERRPSAQERTPGLHHGGLSHRSAQKRADVQKSDPPPTSAPRSTFSPWQIFRFSTKHAFLFEGHSVQSLSRVQLFLTPWTAARQVSLSITNSRGLLKLMPESVMPSNHLILCRPLLLPPSIFPSIGVFSSQSVLLIMWSSIYDYWKDHSFDYMDLCRQSNVSVFYYAV